MNDFLVTISSSICRDAQLLRVFDKKFINEDDVAILEEEVEKGNTDWCDVSCDIVLEEYSSYQGTPDDIKKEISEKYGINPYFVNVYQIQKKDNNN